MRRGTWLSRSVASSYPASAETSLGTRSMSTPRSRRRGFAMPEKARDARRPLIVIPARFSPGATALRYEAEVTARALVQAVFAAGGEPVVVHPYAPDLEIDVDAARERIWFADGVLLPGGGDVAARWSGQQPHPGQYGVDEEQDAFDIAVTKAALADRVPLLAICRGTRSEEHTSELQ